MTNKSLIFVLTALLGCVLFSWGYSNGLASAKRAAETANNERLAKAFEQGQAAGLVKEKIVTEFVYRDRLIQGRTQTIIQKVPVYVSEAADRACTVPVGFVRLHDAAAAGLPAPEPGGSADAAGSGVALSTVAAVTAGNYGTCHAIANQLTALQAAVRAHPAFRASGAQAPIPQ